MSTSQSRLPQLFPVLGAPQIEAAKRFASGPIRTFAPGEIVYDVDDRSSSAWIVLEGSILAARRDGRDREVPITTHQVGEITGELSQLSGRASLAMGRAGAAGCTAAPFDPPHLRALIVGSAEVGEMIMRAFILRRVALIEDGGAGSVLVGRRGSAALTRLEGFLARNGYPHTVLDSGEAEGREIVQRLGVASQDLPLMLCPSGAVLKRPSNSEAGVCLGITPVLNPETVYDVAIVGAGPAGLAAAVYAASEGLSVLVLDQRAMGGQAGASARIENYLGFPTGISGMALAGRAFSQAHKFGAELAIPLEVVAVEGGAPDDPSDPFRLRLTDGSAVQARTVVAASGASYRQPDIPGLARFEGAGVSYWASPIEAKLCEGREIALVGAGNSAGQAVVYLAPRVGRLHVVVRGKSLEASMSTYLIRRIAALPNVELHFETEVVALRGDDTGAICSATFRHRPTGQSIDRTLQHVFLFIGADPNASWLGRCAALDEKGFVRTGQEAPGGAPGRRPYPLETSRPRVFAIGDVRAGSTKRVAAAVGEGAAVVAQIHSLLAGQPMAS